MTLVIGWVLGGLTTSVLVWQQRGNPAASSPGYFRQVALSVIATAAAATLIRVVLYAMYGMEGASVVFGSGWLLGGLVAAWFLTRAR